MSQGSVEVNDFVFMNNRILVCMSAACTNMSVILVDLLGITNISRSLALYNFSIGFAQLFAVPFCGE
jgi:hypothetical protein